jgi:hypothetical protein
MKWDPLHWETGEFVMRVRLVVSISEESWKKGVGQNEFNAS